MSDGSELQHADERCSDWKRFVFVVGVSAGNGLIDFDEFMQMMSSRGGSGGESRGSQHRRSQDAEMRALFAAFDKASQSRQSSLSISDISLLVLHTYIYVHTNLYSAYKIVRTNLRCWHRMTRW